MFKRILVPLDGSQFASRALESAYEVAEHFDSELILLRVVEPARPMSEVGGTFGSIDSPNAATISMETVLEEEKLHIEQAKTYLSKMADTGKCSSLKCTYRVEVGQAGDTIIRTARNEKTDLIVLSSHGTGGIKRAILGSVADEVIRKSGETVLVVHPKSAALTNKNTLAGKSGDVQGG